MTEFILTPNNAIGKLLSSVAPGATTITLEAGDGANFPVVAAPDVLYATLASPSVTRPTAAQVQIVKVTAHASDADTFTCEAVGGATTWDAGDFFEVRVTDELMDSLARKTTSEIATVTPYLATVASHNVFVDTNTIGSAATFQFPASPLDDQIVVVSNIGTSGYDVALDGNGNTVVLDPSPLADGESVRYQFITSLGEWRPI